MCNFALAKTQGRPPELSGLIEIVDGDGYFCVTDELRVDFDLFSALKGMV